ncbi:hypothetical protein [Bacillus sp. FJAT-42315]|uniref:hypothetical protein n=1 Tax=Bacillus sp. FJAT-42315 TaxID=2014077 RepID=UPI000C24BDF6|nr:hypothetical protein [Bacillus sp. FJAT-42315]
MGILAGIVSGIFLGLFLKVIEVGLGIKVYTLLMNVDYIPVIKKVALPELVEFSLHLIVSVVLAMTLAYVVKKEQWTNEQIMIRTVTICFLIGVLLYPTTILSDRTPSITSLSAIFYWLVGHALYGVVLGRFYIKQ